MFQRGRNEKQEQELSCTGSHGGAHGTAGTGVHVFWVLLTFWSRMAPLMGYFVFFSAFWPAWL